MLKFSLIVTKGKGIRIYSAFLGAEVPPQFMKESSSLPKNTR